MRYKKLILSCLVLFVVAGVWLFASSSSKRPGADIPVTFVGYTNDTAGIPTALRGGTNVESLSFAVFHIQNTSRRDFFCYIGPVFWDGGQLDARLSSSGDFNLPPGAGATFAVPVPNVPKAWRCGVVLCHKRNYPRWKFELVRLAERCGIDTSERSWFAVSPEVVR